MDPTTRRLLQELAASSDESPEALLRRLIRERHREKLGPTTPPLPDERISYVAGYRVRVRFLRPDPDEAARREARIVRVLAGGLRLRLTKRSLDPLPPDRPA